MRRRNASTAASSSITKMSMGTKVPRRTSLLYQRRSYTLVLSLQPRLDLTLAPGLFYPQLCDPVRQPACFTGDSFPVAAVTVRVLLAEDEAVDAELLERQLRGAQLDFVLHRVSSEEDFARELREFHPDIIISDHKLPRFGGRAALRLAKEIAPAVPFLLVTGSIDEETAVEYMKSGAAHYILQDRLTRLEAAVRGGPGGPRLQRRAREA